MDARHEAGHDETKMVQSISVETAKAELRTTAQSRRDALPADERKAAAEAIAARKIPLAIAPGTIVSGFMPLKSEINPLPLLQKLSEAGARLALPAIAGRGKPLIMRAWEFGAPLDRGQWGIREPKPEASEVEPNILLVPLLAFDREGFPPRLWRWLLRYDHPSAAGVEAGHRRRHCLCRPGGSKNSDDTARRAPRSRANRARGDRFAVG